MFFEDGEMALTHLQIGFAGQLASLLGLVSALDIELVA